MRIHNKIVLGFALALAGFLKRATRVRSQANDPNAGSDVVGSALSLAQKK